VTTQARPHFDPVRAHRPGTLLDLLLRSYQELLDADPEHWGPESERWKDFDAEAFTDPKIGACVFVTTVSGRPVGFGSYEPQGAGAGWIGHNCIVPEHRGIGYGSRQLTEMVRRMRAQGIREIRSTTGEHPFFQPARAMYEAGGFVETGRRAGGPDPDHRLVDYRLDTRETPIPVPDLAEDI
jgi:GNAT superfamily N-acetyltransferase